MTYTHTANKINELAQNWEEFKKINDRRLTEIESKGKADPLTENHLQNLNSAVEECKARLNGIETGGDFLGSNGNYAPVNYEHKNAFDKYIRKGIDDGLNNIEQKAMTTSTDADGGYLVTNQMATSIVKYITENSPIRQLAAVQNISSNALEVIIEDSQLGAIWAAGDGAVVADSTTPSFAKKTIEAHELIAQPKATSRLIEDSGIDIEAWLTNRLTEAFVTQENDAFINGDGVNKPRGILNYGAVDIEQIASGTSAELDADDIVNLYYTLKEPYARGASFLMNRQTIQKVRLLKEGTTGQYLWNPGLEASQPATILGVPVYTESAVPAPAADSLSVILADFKQAYQIAERRDIRIMRDPYTEKPFIKFYTTKRVGGDVINGNAVKVMKLGV